MSYLKYQGKLYKKVDGGFTARQSDIDSKIDVDAEIAELRKEVAGLKAHNLELTQALENATNLMRPEAYSSYDYDEKDIYEEERKDFEIKKNTVLKTLSSPASRKYLAMIEVVEAAKIISGTYYLLPDDVKEDFRDDYSKAQKNLEILESEEANEQTN